MRLLFGYSDCHIMLYWLKSYSRAITYLLLRYLGSSLSDVSSLELELEEPELELSELNPVGFERSIVSAIAATSGLSLCNTHIQIRQ